MTGADETTPATGERDYHEPRPAIGGSARLVQTATALTATGAEPIAFVVPRSTG